MSTAESTTEALVGRQVVLLRDGLELLAKITGIDGTSPKTAYTVSWTREDNPHWGWAQAKIPPDADIVCSIAHASRIVRVVA